MSHVRTQIHNAIVARLTGLSTTGANVHGRRTRPPTDTLPLMLVYLGSDAGDLMTVTEDRIEERRAELTIITLCKDGGDMEDLLDQMFLEVQQAIATDPTFGGLVKEIGAPSLEPDVDDSLEKPAGMNRITYPITYYLAGSNPALSL